MHRSMPFAALLTFALLIPRVEAQAIDTASLLREMVDLERLAHRPQPWFEQALASSYSRRSHDGGEAWFDNGDVGQYVRTEIRDGRKEHVLADLVGPGCITRFWSANPDLQAVVRFYFDGEAQARLQLPLAALFDGEHNQFGPAFSYLSGTGGNLYFPIPYGKALRISIEERDRPIRLYYEIGHRTYEKGAVVTTFDPAAAAGWRAVQDEVATALQHPQAKAPEDARWVEQQWTIPAGETRQLDELRGPLMVHEFAASVLGTRESRDWRDPLRPHNAWRSLLLQVTCDGEDCIEVPLGDFFGSAPGVNPFETLCFTVREDGSMHSRLVMPCGKSMRVRLLNAGTVPYTVKVKLQVAARDLGAGAYHLKAQWRTWSRQTWPPFDEALLHTSGEGVLVGTTYQIANPVLIWWGEGDQKIRVDGERFPSTFGTGTEDDYGFAYGYNAPFARPYHAQTRVDGPASGGHISLCRSHVLDAVPFRTAIAFDQELWHWMPCVPTWTSVVYWYATPGTPGPVAIDRAKLPPPDLGVRADMQEPLEGELLRREVTGGEATTQRLANCSRAEHLFWHDAKIGDVLTVHFDVATAGSYAVTLNLCMAPDYGRHQLSVNGAPAGEVDGYAAQLYWMQPQLGVFDLQAGDNTLAVTALAPNQKAVPKNLFGLDYIFLVRQ